MPYVLDRKVAILTEESVLLKNNSLITILCYYFAAKNFTEKGILFMSIRWNILLAVIVFALLAWLYSLQQNDMPTLVKDDSAPEYAGALLSVFPESRQIVETQIEDMLNGNVTPEEAVTNMADEINKTIEEYNLVNG